MTNALIKLEQSVAEHKSFSLLDKVHNPSPVLVLDVSGSMAEHCEPGRRKIDALREVVKSLRTSGSTFGQIVFESAPRLTDAIPEPSGGTALHLALGLAATLRPRKLVLVTDGEPDDEQLALDAAARLARPIDVFYVGPGSQRAEKFLRDLARRAGGQYQKTDLAEAPAIAHQVAGLLT